jgi:TetR/AcrR family transcriptional repressor of the ameABC operon
MKKPVGGRPGRAERTRKRIIAHADRVFRERGFRKVTIEELCADLGMSKRTFYRHFPDRDELVVAVIVEGIEQHVPAIIENLTSTGPVDRILRKHFDLLIHNVLSNVSTQLMVDIQVLMPELWDRIEQFRSGAVGIITELLRRGQQEGSIRPEVDPTVAGKLIQVILTHVAHPRFMAEQGLSFDQFITTFKGLLLHGVLVPKMEE